MTETTKIAFAFDSNRIAAWQKHAVELISELETVQIITFIHVDSNRNSTQGFPLKQYLEFENKKYRVKPNALEYFPFDAIFSKTPAIIAQLKGKQLTLSLEAMTTLSNHQLDLIIDFSGRFPVADDSDLCRHGVWQFFFGKENYPIYAHPGQKEVLTSMPYLESKLVSISTDTTPTVLYQSYSPVDLLYVNKTLNWCLWKCANYPARVLQQQLAGSSPTKVTGSSSWFPLWSLGQHFFKRVNHSLSKRFYNEQWTLFYRRGKEVSFDFKNYKPLLPPKDRLWADPFILHRDGKHYVFIEESFLPPRKKGFISVMVMDEHGKFDTPQKIIEEDYHMSYPFLFEWEGDLYMMPESNQNRTLDIYKCTSFPYEWEFHKHVMQDITAVDATIHFEEDRCWMFVNIKSPQGASAWDELHLFYADSPFADHWTAHPMNPVVTDVRSARPAGNIYKMDGKLYRPSQNCSVRYGYGLKVHEIKKLTTTEYQESEVLSIEPDWDPKIKTVHTFNHQHSLAFIDGIMNRPKS